MRGGHAFPREHGSDGGKPLDVLGASQTARIGVATDDDDLVRLVHLTAHRIEGFGEARRTAYEYGRDD